MFIDRHKDPIHVPDIHQQVIHKHFQIRVFPAQLTDYHHTVKTAQGMVGNKHKPPCIWHVLFTMYIEGHIENFYGSPRKFHIFLKTVMIEDAVHKIDSQDPRQEPENESWTGTVSKRGPMPIRFSEELQPGEAYEIRHIDPNG